MKNAARVVSPGGKYLYAAEASAIREYFRGITSGGKIKLLLSFCHLLCYDYT